ncbi:MAG: hypothetical protein CL908_02820 [Deltaproteobacteria bacterium]|nr:hypothetical protein [Deltaproteobacteria bacterium]
MDAARKHAQKGAKAKALKEYNRLLKADARDAKLLLEVGDAYRRWGQAEEAIAQYGKVAQQYRQDGFDARAVAVFKQILNLDPKHYSAYVSLSELYQRMGLDSDAIGALQTAADGYHKEGRKAEALDLLRQMAALDPTNTTSRLKVAELLRQEDMQSEALVEYEAVAAEFENQQDRDQLITVLERILEIKPDEINTLMGLVQNLMAAGELKRAEPLAVRALNVSAEAGQYELLIDLYAQMGDEVKLADATRGLARFYRDRGDEEKARELMQRLPAEEVSSSSRLAVDVSEVDEPFLTLSDESEQSGLQQEIGPTDGDLGLALDESDEIELSASGGEPVAAEALPEGDPDQLLAEASVYLRYGKREQAIVSLCGVIAQDPEHRGALEKLGEAYAEGGQTAEAVAAWIRAADQIRLAADRQALAVLKDRIAALDPVAAEQVGEIEAVAETDASEDPPPVVELDLDVEVDLDMDSAIDEVSANETESGLDFGNGQDEFEIELDEDSLSSDLATEDADTNDLGFEERVPEVASHPGDDDDSFEFEIDADTFGDPSAEEEVLSAGEVTDASVEFDLDGGELTSQSSGTFGGRSTMSSARIGEELEEAEFYIAQDMFDEAEVILTRVLEVAPNHPSAMLRMGEIAAARGAGPEQVASANADSHEVVVESTENDVETPEVLAADGDIADDDSETLGAAVLDLELSSAGMSDADLDEEIEEAAAATESSTTAFVDESEFEIEVDLGDDEADCEARLEMADTLVDPVEDVAAVEPETSAKAEEESAVEGMDAGETFDLREALADVLGEDESESPNEQSSNVLSTVEDGFESIFSDFKKGVTATLEEGDYDTRYDLGIAYREMELYADAIGEFRVCLESETRRFDSLYLMGLCARDLLRFDDAVNHLEQALGLPEIPEDRMAGVYFDLSIAQEGAGDAARALATLRRVIELEPGFPGAADRLVALEAGASSRPQLGEPGEAFESFDELFEDDDEAGDHAMAEGVTAETFESFDDVVSEAEAVFAEAEALENEADSVAVDTASDESQPDPDQDSKSSSKSGRNKISFI